MYLETSPELESQPTEQLETSPGIQPQPINWDALYRMRLAQRVDKESAALVMASVVCITSGTATLEPQNPAARMAWRPIKPPAGKIRVKHRITEDVQMELRFEPGAFPEVINITSDVEILNNHIADLNMILSIMRKGKPSRARSAHFRQLFRQTCQATQLRFEEFYRPKSKPMAKETAMSPVNSKSGTA